jgi:uncharacterized repeat protein (TIGR01451 family)
VVAFVLGCAVVNAQSPPPQPLPNIQFFDVGQVNAVARLSDGSVIVGGQFAYVNGTPRRNLAKFLPDGSLDPDWNPSPLAIVTSLVVDDGNNVFVGGAGYLDKLSPVGTGAPDPAWNANVAGGTVFALALDGSGSLFLGGSFTQLNGAIRTKLGKVSTSGSGAINATWAPSVTGQNVGALHCIGTHVFVGGAFSSISGTSRSNLAKLATSGTGAVDATWNPAPNQRVSALASDADGNLFVGGVFTTIGAAARSKLAKLTSVGAGSADLSWNPNPVYGLGGGAFVQSLLVDGSTLYVGGWFETIGGASRRNLAKLSTTASGTTDGGWAADVDRPPSGLAIDGSRVFVAGNYESIAAQRRAAFVTVSSSTGAVDPVTQDVERNGTIHTLLRQSNGGLVVGGAFRRADAGLRDHLARILADGTLDANWQPSLFVGADTLTSIFALAEGAGDTVYAGGSRSNGLGVVAKLDGSGSGGIVPAFANSANGSIQALAVQANELYVGGQFNRIPATSAITCNHLARLDATTGALDSSWCSTADAAVNALVLDGAGGLFVGGDFTVLRGTGRAGLAKVATATGVADADWTPGQGTTSVRALLLDGSGALFVGGSFSAIGGAARNNLAKLEAGGFGAADPSWNPGPNGLIRALARDGGGSLFVGGDFGTIAGAFLGAGLARLSDAGTATVDLGYNPQPVPGPVHALLVRASGHLAVGGALTQVGGQPRIALAEIAAPSCSLTRTRILSDDPDPSVAGTPFTVQVEVSAAAGTPAGTASANFIATACGPVSLVSGLASCDITTLNGGTDNITATFAPSDATQFCASSGRTQHTSQAFDFGDAPASYGTNLAQDGARHPAQSFQRLGTLAGDTDVSGHASAAADGDDVNASDDEDGVMVPLLVRGTSVEINLDVMTPGLLNVWFDWNADGDFLDSGERVAFDFDPFSFPLPFSVSPPTNAAVGQTFARFRFGPAGLGPTGEANSGEVEDYAVTVQRALPRVNAPASANTVEDTTGAPITVFVSDADSAAASLVVAATSDNQALVADAGLAITPGGNAFERLLTITPVADANTPTQGSAAITVTATDIDGDLGSDVITFTVNARNDPPAFDVGTDPAFIAGSSGTRSLPAFASVIRFGPADESGQGVLQYNVIETGDPASVVSGTAIDTAGTLGFVLSGNDGTATFTATLQDNGGTLDGGQDTSSALPFSIIVGGPSADLAITKQNGATLVELGQPTTYTISVRNDGPQAATGAQVDDDVVGQLAGASWSCAASGGGSCPPFGAGSIIAAVDLPVAATATFTLTGTVVTTGTHLVNTASVASPAGLPDFDSADNTATDSDAVRLFDDGFE